MKLKSLITAPLKVVSYVKSFFTKQAAPVASQIFGNYEAMMDKIKADLAPIEKAAGDHLSQAATHTALAAEFEDTIQKAKTLLANLETLTTRKIVS